MTDHHVAPGAEQGPDHPGVVIVVHAEALDGTVVLLGLRPSTDRTNTTLGLQHGVVLIRRNAVLLLTTLPQSTDSTLIGVAVCPMPVAMKVAERKLLLTGEAQLQAPFRQGSNIIRMTARTVGSTKPPGGSHFQLSGISSGCPNARALALMWAFTAAGSLARPIAWMAFLKSWTEAMG